MQPRTRTVGGVTYMEVGPGQWQAQAAPAPETSPVIYGSRPAPQATPQAPAVETNTRTQTRRTEAEIPTVGVPTGVERPVPGGPARGIPGSPYGGAESGLMWNEDGTRLVPIPGFQRPAAPATADQAAERLATARSKLEAADNLQRQLDQMRAIYDESFAGWGPQSFVNSILPTDANNRFGQLADVMSVDLKPLVRNPGEGTWTDADQALLDRLTPRPGRWDGQNETAFAELQARIDAIRARYGPEVPDAQNSEAGTNLSTAIYRPDQQDRGTPDNQADVRQINDPVRRGHAMEIANMMNNREVPEQEILDYHARHFPGENPVGLRDALVRRSDPNSEERRAMAQGRRPFSPDPGWYQTERDATGLEQISGAVLDSQVGTAGTHYLNSALGGWAPDLAGLVGGDTEAIRAGMEGQRAQNPLSALGGDIGGFVGAAGVGGRVASNLGILQNAPALRMALGDGLYGASYGAGSSPEDRASGAMLGGALQAGGGLAGRAGMNALGSTVRGVSNPTVQRLRDAGVPLTTGQTVGQSGLAGQVLQNTENAMTSLPVIGPMIRNRQIDARNAFNTNTWDEALAPIGGNVGGRTGEQASEEASRQARQAYGNVFAGRTFTVDPPMQSALAAEAGRIPSLLPDFRANMDHIINQQVGPMLARGDVQGALRAVKEGRSALAAQNGSGEAVRSLGAIEASVQRMMSRQHPGAYRELRNADRTYGLTATAQNATTAARDNPLTPGVATPRQLGTAAAQNARSFGGRDLAASTRRPFYQSQRDAQTVLPEQLPNSGTYDRAILGTALLTAAGGGDYALGDAGAVTGPAAGVLGGLAALYSRPGQRLVNGMLAARPQAVRNAGDFMVNAPIRLPGPQVTAPFQTPMTLGQILGAITGTTLNSTGGLQAEGRPYPPL